MLRATLALLLLAPFGAPAAPPAPADAWAQAGACKPKRKRPKRKKRRRGRKAPKAPASAAPAAAAPARANGPTPTLRRSNRMEFDARLVKGERATGAVYLFQRVPRRLPPLVQLTPNPLDRIVRPVLQRGVDSPPTAEPKRPPGGTK